MNDSIRFKEILSDLILSFLFKDNS